LNGFRLENVEYRDARQALFGVLLKLLQDPSQQAIIRVPDEDAANLMTEHIQDAVDRIKIEFDGSEKGPNPLWTPTKLIEDKGKVVLEGAYGQTSHQDQSIIVNK